MPHLPWLPGAHRGRATEQFDENAAFQLVELHSLPSPGIGDSTAEGRESCLGLCSGARLRSGLGSLWLPQRNIGSRFSPMDEHTMWLAVEDR
jgi:hypothetical protein